jgi:subtilisin family serine protease
MDGRMRAILTTLIPLLILTWTALSPVAFSQSNKLTPRASAVLQAGDATTLHNLWLYFDSTRVAPRPVVLTERSLERRAKVDPDSYLIDYRDYPLSEDLLDEIRSSGIAIKSVSRWLKAVAVEVGAVQIDRIRRISGLKKIDLAITLTSDRPVESRERPGMESQSILELDYGYSLFQNQFPRITKLHNAGLSGAGVLIGLFDSGFNTGHPAFDSTHIIQTYDFIHDQVAVDGPECPDDIETDQQDSHGTLTLGVIGGYVPGTLIGTAYGADFLLAKTEITCGGEELKIEEYDWIAAAEWADSLGADIISSSLGYTVFTDSGSYTHADLNGHTAAITLAAEAAAAKNILVVTAAGNERQRPWGTIIFPADGDSVLAVGAVDGEGELAPFSSPGPTADGRIKPDIVTLGVSVYSARSLSESYRTASGTSFATPLTAGGAALAFEFDPTLTAMELLDLIRETGSRSSNPDNNYGYGLYDAAASADIIRIDPVSPIEVEENQVVTVPLTTSGRATVTPALALAQPVAGVEITDFGDGTGELYVQGVEENLGNRNLLVTADIGYFVDTTVVALHTFFTFADFVRAGPNPFTDEVNIYLDTAAGRNAQVSVFNSAGEKVWERVNNSPFSSDVIVWDGRNNSGDVVAAGVYLVLVKTDRIERRLKLLKVN